MNTSLLFNQSSWILLSRNQIRWKKLREYYSGLLNLTSFHQPLSEKTMIYSCHSTCFGWGDRLRGITSVYILALLTRRRFMIDMDHPCSISHVLQPNLIDWKFQKPAKTSLKNRNELIINTMPLRPVSIRENMVRFIESKDFISLWSKYDDIRITTNGFYITNALRNPFSNSSWLLGSLPLKQATQEFLFPLLFELLFKPTLIVYQSVENILLLKHQQLTCLHLRIGKNPSNPSDITFPARANMTKIMLDFLDNNPCLVRPNQTLLFIASDSEQAVRNISKYYPKSSIMVPGPIIHIDDNNSHGLSTKKTLCDGLVKVITEFYILGECQTSLLSHSGFSLWANRRRLNPNDQLFIYDENLKMMKKSQY